MCIFATILMIKKRVIIATILIIIIAMTKLYNIQYTGNNGKNNGEHHTSEHSSGQPSLLMPNSTAVHELTSSVFTPSAAIRSINARP